MVCFGGGGADFLNSIVFCFNGNGLLNIVDISVDIFLQSPDKGKPG